MVSAPPSPTTSAATSDCQLHANAPHAEPTLCRYAGKRCFNARATKRNGSLHNLCHVHRVRANQNQRRMELKRRLSRVRVDNTSEAAHAALYHAIPPSSSLTLDMGDIDAHFGWTAAPHHQPTPHSNSTHHQQLLPDYTLNAFVGSVLSDESLFMDLRCDGFAKDAAYVNVNHMNHTYLQDAASHSNSSAYMMHSLHQQQLAPESAYYLYQSPSDMWIVPNFLLTL